MAPFLHRASEGPFESELGMVCDVKSFLECPERDYAQRSWVPHLSPWSLGLNMVFESARLKSLTHIVVILDKMLVLVHVHTVS